MILIMIQSKITLKYKSLGVKMRPTLKNTVILSIIILCPALVISQSDYTFNLDIGNDGYYEVGHQWPYSTTAPSIENEWVNETGEFISHAISCDCPGCYAYANPVSGERFCLVPVRIKDTNYAGTLSAYNANVSYTEYTELKNISYADVHARNQGGCWRVEYGSGATTTLLFSVPGGMTCPQEEINNYTGEHHAPPNKSDAVVDAVYRLMNQTMDENQDGILQDFQPLPPDNQVIRADGEVKGQSLWGPIEVKLITWI